MEIHSQRLYQNNLGGLDMLLWVGIQKDRGKLCSHLRKILFSNSAV